jgi:hypothetical protein
LEQFCLQSEKFLSNENMKKFAFSLCCCIVLTALKAQIPFTHPGTVSVAGTSVSDIRQWSAFHNPAVLSLTSIPMVGLRVENRYVISALNTQSFSVVYPADFAVTAVSFSRFGFDVYNETTAGIAFARNFSDKICLGLQFNYLTVYQQSMNTHRGTLFPQAGLTIKLSPKTVFGFQTWNPFAASIKNYTIIKRIPSIFSVGISSSVTNDFSFRLQADAETGSGYRFAAAIQYAFSDQFIVQSGLYSHDFLVPCFGFQARLRQFSFDLQAELHPLLGVNTSLGISVPLNFRK